MREATAFQVRYERRLAPSPDSTGFPTPVWCRSVAGFVASATHLSTPPNRVPYGAPHVQIPHH